MIFLRRSFAKGCVGVRGRRLIYCSAIAAIVAIAVAAAVVLRTDRTVPDVILTSLRGEKIPLSSLRGKVVLVSFWATDCVPCVKGMPAMAELYRRFEGSAFEAVFVAMPHDRPDRVLAFVTRNALPFKVALDVQGEAVRAFGDVHGTPLTYIVDKQGRVVRRILGKPDIDALSGDIEHRLRAAS